MLRSLCRDNDDDTNIVYSKIQNVGLVLSRTHSLRMWYYIILHSSILETLKSIMNYNQLMNE